MVRIAAASVALASVAALAVAGVAERASVADSFTVLGHLHCLWFPTALLLEFASMAAFAIMLRRLLAAAGASVGLPEPPADCRLPAGDGQCQHWQRASATGSVSP